MSAMVERERLKAIYGKSKKWIAKVDRMTDTQVIAVFMKLLGKGKV